MSAAPMVYRAAPLDRLARTEDGSFAVHRRSPAPKRFTGGPTRVRQGSLGLRLAGDGGIYGYLGRYPAEGRTVRAFVTDRAKVALLDVGGASLAVSPGDRDRFLAEVGRGA